jgi:hypothetical protein
MIFALTRQLSLTLCSPAQVAWAMKATVMRNDALAICVCCDFR